MSRLSFNYAQERCVRLAGKAMQSTDMIYPGARIGVAVSGGVDSWVLLQVLKIRQRIVPFHFDIMALHVNPGFDVTSHAPLLPWVQANGVAAHVEVTDHGPRGHSPENRNRSACFYCAMLRRKRLFGLCTHYGLTHLAFGHNADDLVSTFFMNMFQGGRVDGMSMKEPFFGGALMVIRPLMLVEKKLIIKAAKTWELPVWSNPCPSAMNGTRRSSVLEDVENLCREHKERKKNIFNALCRWQHGLHLAAGKQAGPEAEEE
ncbi:tRNA lysidine(34) synthetase [Desulfovibrio cuneatus]|uniref:tRNA lysidine(34) synthetase n=1 Tax=Desulfovibrio cuneatus TaxID=159728 RepID=UPI0003F7A3F3|nr:tRNA 2-thiocytidine biosynthesis TtcA family protein [Desulfovibrio cuneatus]